MLRGKRILITSGPTLAPLDAVRYLTNISTGRFGCLLATEALRRKAKVTFVYGKGSQHPSSPSVRGIEVITNWDVERVLRRELDRGHYDVVIHAMAVLDFEPVSVQKTKTTSRKGGWTIHLKPAPKIIAQIKKWSPRSLLVGFKLEAGVKRAELLLRARRLLKESQADFVLANQLTEGDDRKHTGWLLDRRGEVVAKAKGKISLARLIFSALEKKY